VFELRQLRLFETHVGPREVGTGIEELVVEPQLVEFVAQIVVAKDIAAGAARRVEARPSCQELGEPGRPGGALATGPKGELDGRDQVAFDPEPAVGVGLTQREIGRAQDFQQQASVAQVHPHSRCGAPRATDLVAVPEHEDHGRVTHGVQQPPYEPAIHGIGGADVDSRARLPGRGERRHRYSSGAVRILRRNASV
jgi:hypothetical protein